MHPEPTGYIKNDSQPPVSNTTQSTTMTIKYAGFWIRYAAAMLDGLIIGIPSFIVLIFINIKLLNLGTPILTVKIISQLIQLVITYSYFVSMTYNKGATVGKRLAGLVVITDDFQKLSFGKVLFRETLGKFISAIILCIGYFMAGFTEKKQALHDKMVHSVVVYKDPSKPRSKWVVFGACILPGIMIIGILASVILSSLIVARQKARDAQSYLNINSTDTPNLTTDYTYNLPNGWQNKSNAKGLQAANADKGYSLHVSVVPIPPSYGKINSVTDIYNPTNVNKIMSQSIKDQLPNAIISNTSLTTIGGESAYATPYTTIVTINLGGKDQSENLFMLQYNAVHNGLFYTIIFGSSIDKQQVAMSDFQIIINSFTFK